jgi:RING finger protein 113A
LKEIVALSYPLIFDFSRRRIFPDLQRPVTMATVPIVVEFKKPAAIKGNMRKRKPESESIPAREDQSEHIIHKDKKQKEDSEIDDSVLDHAPTVGVVYEATRSVNTQSRDVATPSLEIDTAIENDAITRAEKAKEFLNTKVKDDKVYRGLANYNKFFVEKDSLGPKGAGLVAGPLRSNQYARVTTFIDYKPDLCKDYNETGYCGFGDTCKFLHDRGDYKRGWELDKEWEEKMKAAKEGNRENSEAPSRWCCWK